jgi:16S rRNA (guanine527-N7)-methyltransferase
MQELPLITAHIPALPEEVRQQLVRFMPLFQSWNERINLVSRKDIEHLEERHVLHSLSIMNYITFKPDTRLVDIGAGGGFPGLVLAIANPQAHFTLVDSIGKKMRAVEAMAEELGLKNVTVLNMRSEALREQYEFVLGRAVTALPDFWQMTRHLLHCRNKNSLVNGMLYLKGGPLEEELSHPNLRSLYHQVHSLHQVLPLPFYETKVLVYLSACRPPVRS